MKVKKITGNYVLFDDGTRISDYHNQDCCENVYADFKQLKDTNIWLEDFERIRIGRVKNKGINLRGYFIPCYNEQNGYYSSDLTIIIKYPDGKEKRIDISDCVEDKIF